MQNPSGQKIKTPFYNNFLIFFPVLFVYLLTLYPTVGTEDSGEFITSAVKLDIAHPPGYPLHTLLGWIFSKIIFFGNMGWRVNLMSAFFGACAITALYIFLKRLIKSDTVAFCLSLFFAFTDIFWSQAIRTEAYTLDSFLLITVSYLLLLWHESNGRKYLYLAALIFGLGISNHQIIGFAGPAILLFVLCRNWKEFFNPKNIAIALLLFLTGLLPYLYLPIRSSVAEYNNPAYMKHEPMNTWDKFSGFVNRNIYGGTIAANDSEENSGTQTMEPPSAIEKISKTIQEKASLLISNNLRGFIPLMQIIFGQMLWIPLILIIPGVYYIIRKSKKYSIYLFGLFISYTVLIQYFVNVGVGVHPLAVFSNRPFYITSIITLTILSAAGLKFLFDQIKNRLMKNIVTAALIVLPVLAIIPNFSLNNESNNYVAYDLNKNLLDSIPENGYLISTGKDNFTFPLYYLKQIDNYRRDINLEIYYGAACLNKDSLDERLKSSGQSVIFIDLLPCGFKTANLTPYNFVYAYGDISNLPPSRDIESFGIRGMRKNMDYPNNRLKGIHYIKIAYALKDQPDKQRAIFDKVADEIRDVPIIENFIYEYLNDMDTHGLFY
jgi:4-amino-4-deoxy-L-arabinose transferase-like glycosyltransferase